MPIRSRPIFTDVFDDFASFKPQQDSSYVFADSEEARSEHSEEWEQSCADVRFLRITKQLESSFQFVNETGSAEIRLRSGSDLREFWRMFGSKRAYLDITGLEHRVWAPLLKTALSLGMHLSAVYREPVAYRFSPLPREGDIFDLSERISGIAALPGFASIAEPEDEDQVTFVALLGFEGVRFKYCIEQVQPPRKRIIPVVGVPGFQPEYPFYTYDGNRPVLDETGSWSNVRYARANCPFSLFYLLEDIAEMNALDVIKIATIGTKPHALGAVLFSILSPRSVELIYDHPIRKASRTEGKGRLLLYHLHCMSVVSGV